MCYRQQRILSPAVYAYFVVLLLLQLNLACTAPQTLAAHARQPDLIDSLPGSRAIRHQQETFKEEALVTPLQDGRTLVHLHFTQWSAYKQHFRSFPKGVGQLAAAVPFDEVELSLTQGRWHQHWGAPPVQYKPTGAELLAKFSAALVPSRLPRLWSTLSHALGGMFCASLNFVARPEATAAQAITLACQAHGTAPQGAPGLTGNTSHSTPAAAAGNTIGALDRVDTGAVQGNSGFCGVLSPAAAGQSVLYAALPQEASCTENLTPWLKLLPCRDASGLGQLLQQRDKVFGAEYHSMRVLIRVQRDQQLRPLAVTLTQTFAMVLRPDKFSSSSSRSECSKALQLAGAVVEQLMDQKQLLGCPVAQLSKLYVHLHACSIDKMVFNSSSTSSSRDGGADLSADTSCGMCDTSCGMRDSDQVNTSTQGQQTSKQWQLCTGSNRACIQPDAISSVNFGGICPTHSTAPSPSTTALRITYDLARQSKHRSQAMNDPRPDTDSAAAQPGTPNLQAQPGSQDAVRPSDQAETSSSQPPAASSCLPVVTRDITGSGALHGGIVLQVQLPAAAAAAPAAAAPGQLGMCILQVVPWQVRLWLHTLQLHINGRVSSLAAHLTHRQVSAASDRSAPLSLHLCLSLPSGTQTVTLSVQFSKAFLTAFEHPPDAYRGFDVPAAQLSLTGMPCTAAADTLHLQQQARPPGGADSSGGSSTSEYGTHSSDCMTSLCSGEVVDAPLLRELAELKLQVYSPGLVVPLAVPDFSMPYNVICLTSTVLAVFLGASMNTLLLRPGQAERIAYQGSEAAEAARRRKKLKLALVVLLFGGLGVYLDPALQDMVLSHLREWGFTHPEAQASVPV